ncbi:MAG TPA: flagellar basal body L-ring protein FlgH [Sphingomonadaceae bacterium]|jgi:flagellar L-ring protein precursor FlgH|nr:flagellar basal body L-ring protein FlgH [Sphingomonadaceae bacterium]
MRRIVPVVLLATLTSGCGVAGRLGRVGQPPKMTKMADPIAPLLEPSLGNEAAAHRTGVSGRTAASPSASLFRTGAGAFFHDQRASRVGDILTIKVDIADKAVLDNSTSRSRTGTEAGGIAGFFGLESKLSKILPGNPDPSKLVDTSSSSVSAGTGNTARSEQISTVIAGIVTGVLPNGNLMVQGRQEVRVNFELRELVVSGIVRPQDIARDNSILHSQMAEARISYGGRGQLTDAQQARWGQQIYDALFPF